MIYYLGMIPLTALFIGWRMVIGMKAAQKEYNSKSRHYSKYSLDTEAVVLVTIVVVVLSVAWPVGLPATLLYFYLRWLMKKHGIGSE